MCAHFVTWFIQDWIISIHHVDDYSHNLHYIINELITEHNWRLNEIMSLPIGLRSYYLSIINNKIESKNLEAKTLNK